jgi:nicotinamidase-related amidase
MEKHALIIIDMQNDFIDRASPLKVKNIINGLRSLKPFIARLRKLGVLIVYTRHLYDGRPNPSERQLFPEVIMNTLHEHTHGAAIHRAIKPHAKDIIINKHRYDAFYGTKLNEILKRNRITEVIITGTMTDVCCACTAHSVMMNDYKLIFVSDLTFTSERSVHNATLKNIRSNFGRVLNSKQTYKEIMENTKK